MKSTKMYVAVAIFAVIVLAQVGFGQGLNWEGQTGAFITPFAYTASSPAGSFGRPEVAFHYLNSGSVVGNDYQFSVTEGVAKRMEFGYTQAFSSAGSSGLSFLFANGFSSFHGKLTLINENAGKTKWVPAIAIGAIGRTGIQRVGSVLATADRGVTATTNNADVYLVATKTVTQVKHLPMLFNFGIKATNASVFGVAGNAPNWQGRLFGAAAFVVTGPKKTTLIFGSEAAQQPHHVEGLPTSVTIPTTLTYFVRAVPPVSEGRLQLDFGVAQIAGKIAPTIDLKARARVATGISYHF